MRLAMDGRRSLGARGFDEAEGFAVRLVHPVPEVLHPVLILNLQVLGVRASNIRSRGALGQVFVHIHEKHASLLQFYTNDRPYMKTYDRPYNMSTMEETTTTPPRTRAAGDRSRRKVLEQAADLATLEGLEGLTLGRLATAAGMPKSSLYQLFGSKEELQLATVEAARTSFIAEVVAPALSQEQGRACLLSLCEGYLDYVDSRVFPGGCFFVGAAAELGGQSGRLHDRVAVVQQEWRDLLAQEADLAVQKGQLPEGADGAQIAFELGSILAGTNIISVLHDDHVVIDRARTAVRTRLGVAT